MDYIQFIFNEQNVVIVSLTSAKRSDGNIYFHIFSSILAYISFKGQAEVTAQGVFFLTQLYNFQRSCGIFKGHEVDSTIEESLI